MSRYVAVALLALGMVGCDTTEPAPVREIEVVTQGLENPAIRMIVDELGVACTRTRRESVREGGYGPAAMYFETWECAR